MRDGQDKLTIAIIIALGLISLSVIFAANRTLAVSQLAFWIIGLILFTAASNFDYRSWQKLSVPVYVISAVALVLVLIVGENVRGSVRWIDLGIVRLQPSEVAKVAAIISLSVFYLKRTARNLKDVALSLLIIAPLFGLIFIEPDIGSAMAIIAIWIGISFAAGLKVKHLAVAGTLAIICLPLFYNLLATYQQERVLTFINPSRDPLGSGYNIIQSKISVGSGQLFGKGLGLGSQSQLNFLPESESDFIFAATAEQLGFVGAALIIIFITWLIIRMIKISQTSDRFGQMIIIGTVSVFLYQFLVNVGMNMGIVPVTGITLPLVSYGGSSLISKLLLLGIVLSIRKFDKYQI